MSNKTKKFENNITEMARNAGETAKAIGLTIMTAAAVVESVGIHGPKHEKAVLVKAESPVSIVNVQEDFKATAQRREREEHTPHYSGYSATQRSPSRTGKA